MACFFYLYDQQGFEVLKIKYFYSVQDLYPQTLLVKRIINKHGFIDAIVTNTER